MARREVTVWAGGMGKAHLIEIPIGSRAGVAVDAVGSAPTSSSHSHRAGNQRLPDAATSRSRGHVSIAWAR